MATQQNPHQESAGTSKPHSLKEEIISKIRQQEELRRDRDVPGVRGDTVGIYDAGSGVRTEAASDRDRTRAAEKPRSRFSWSNVFGHAGTRDIAMYARQLATLVDVGIPLLRSLQLLAERSSNAKMRAVSADLARRVEEGQPLSTALSAHPRTFSRSFVAVVRAGEAGGILDEALRRLADLLERRYILRRRVIGAMAYPAVALLVEIVVIAFIVFWALPKLLSAYPDQSQLPGPTLALLGFTHWVAANIWLLLLVAAAIAAVIFFIIQSKKARAVWDAVVLRLPLFGNMARKLNVAKFSRTVGTLVAAGIPLLDALAIAADTADNAVVERTLHRVRTNVEHGGSMEEPMRREPVFDPIVVDMVMVGDEAGALDTVLLKVADTYDAEVDNTLNTITSLLEPLLIIMLGVAVGFLAIAVFLPYVRLVRNPQLMVE